MDAVLEKKEVLKGGEFLIKAASAKDIFIPEDFNEEQRMFAGMVTEFIQKRIQPNLDAIDKQQEGLMVQLLDEAAELGLLGASLPEEYGGMGVNVNTESFLSECMGDSFSFGVAMAAHTGIGTLPILYFGTEEQKQKYLPKLASGEYKAAYCLTEPGSGSDALAAKTKATLTEDGKHYIIEGQKMWITNGGFADILTVFAQIDGDKFTGFIIDAKSENINLGAEEDKLGIKGSSTRQIFFEGVKVPVENVLGDIGKGHRIAFSVLNTGRLKLGAIGIGGGKSGVKVATQYANERKQFGVPISSFGAIQHKLAEMAIQTFVCESSIYRVSGQVKDKVDEIVAAGKAPNRATAKQLAAEEYAVECAMMKIFGSEIVDYVVDEAVQVFGGTGYSEEYPVARAYRDSRINRIFEGTNEINRLLSVGMILKRAMKGQLDLMGPAMAIQKELAAPAEKKNFEGFLAAEKDAIVRAKKAVLMVAGSAVQKFGPGLEKEQEVIMNIADMLIYTFTAESALLRVEKMVETKGEADCALYIDMAKTWLSDSMEKINLQGKHAVCGYAEGDLLHGMLSGLKRFTKYEAYNTIAARRRVANALIEANDYCF